MKAKVLNVSMQQRKKSKGLTLIELLIALTLGMGILIALSSVYIAAKQSFRFQDSTGRMQEDASYALELMSREIRMTGFSGCVGVETVVTTTPTTSTITYPALIWNESSPSGIAGLNPLATLFPTDTGITSRPYAPPNIFRGFDSGQSSMFSGTASTPDFVSASSIFFAGGLAESAALSSAMSTTTSVINANTSTTGWGGKNLLLIISDCVDSNLFRGAVTVVGGSMSIAHATTDGNTSSGFRNDKIYGTDATLVKAQWIYYYIATRSGATAPSLYRLNFDGESRGSSEEIIANVEGMAIHYGEATSASPLVVANWRTTAASVTDWSRVVAVRVGLMMVSGQTDSNADVVPTSTTLLGASYTIPTSNSARVRNEFSTTIVLRNRVAPR